jgi:serpin B
VYFADSENVDFTKKEEAAETMNSWVEKETENKISNLVDSKLLNELTRIVLINALYFKGDWKEKFDLANTEKMNFYKTPSETVKVDAMTNKRFKFFSICISEELNAKVLKLPIHGDASMMFVLPNERDGLAELESNIDKVFSSCEFEEKLVNVFLPKFKIEYQIDFKAVLQNVSFTTLG